MNFATDIRYVKIYAQNQMLVDSKWLPFRYIGECGMKGRLLFVRDYNHQQLVVEAQQDTL